MFSDKEIRAYKKISAPPGLYEKIKSSATKKSRFSTAKIIRIAGSVAACFVLISAVLLFAVKPSPEIICNGQTLEDSVLFYDISPTSDMRTSPVFSIPFEFRFHKATEITVSYGNVVSSDGEYIDGKILTGETEIWWEIPRDDKSISCEMVLEDKNGTTIITFDYDNTEKTIRATKETK